MRYVEARGRLRVALTPRRVAALRGMLVGAVLSLLLVATPLWLIGGSGSDSATVTEVTPLAALATAPVEPAHFDISAVLVGGWVGEVCPDEGEPIEVHFEFTQTSDDSMVYALSVDGEVATGVVGTGQCDVDGENLEFHSFLAMLNDCGEACGIDRTYVGHFEDGTLVGDYADAAAQEGCTDCVKRGTWWLVREDGINEDLVSPIDV